MKYFSFSMRAQRNKKTTSLVSDVDRWKYIKHTLSYKESRTLKRWDFLKSSHLARARFGQRSGELLYVDFVQAWEQAVCQRNVFVVTSSMFTEAMDQVRDKRDVFVRSHRFCSSHLSSICEQSISISFNIFHFSYLSSIKRAK